MSVAVHPSRAGRSRIARALLATVAPLLVIGCQSTAPALDSESPDAVFPAVVMTKFGEVTVPSRPARVVALGWADAEVALALGVQPVGASDWLAFGGEGVGPWASGRYTTPPEIIGTLEPSYEAVAALNPDVILDVKSSGDPGRYEKLSQVAPTIAVPPGADNYLVTVEQQTTMIATALGLAEAGKQLLANLEQTYADQAAAHPEFAQKTATVASYYSGGFGAYVTQSERAGTLYRLGFVPDADVQSQPATGFSIPVSDERLDLLDCDLLIVQLIGKTRAELEAVETFRTLPVVRDGRAIILDDPDISRAFSLNSPLSTRYALERLIPLLVERTS